MYRVLLVEDDETARKQLARVVKKEGFEVMTAENGRIGLEVFNKELPEIVITDLKMPDIDGMEVVHTVKRISPNVQVILVTAFGEVENAIAAIREGVLDYVKKPVDLNQITLSLGRAREKINLFKKVSQFPYVLLADDEDMIRKRLSRVLEKEGWEVLAASDGREAVELFSQTKIDVVLLDIKMPKMDGLAALHEMRNINNDFEAIILTGYGDESSAIQAMRDGAMNFLKKPIDLDQMILAVEKALEKLNSERSLKYRLRELELAREVIAKITEEQEVIISINENVKDQSKDFAQKLLDSMPLGLLVIDDSYKIRYVNRSLQNVIGYSPEKFDEELIEKMKKMGVNKLDRETFFTVCSRLFETTGNIEIISTGTYSFLTLTMITIVGKDKEKLVMIVVRGERPQR